MREAETYFEAGGYESVLNNMDDKKLRRLFRLAARAKIRQGNSMRGEGLIF